jgi:hypothetical protein
MPNDPRSLLERHPMYNARGGPPVMAAATRQATPNIHGSYYSNLPDQDLAGHVQQGDQAAAAEMMRRLDVGKAGPYPGAVRQAAQLPVQDPTGLGGFIGKGQERQNAAGVNVTDIVKGFIKEKFPSVGASPGPVADPGGMTGAGDVLGGAPVPGPNPRGVGRAPQIQPVGPPQMPQNEHELDAGLGLPTQAPTGAAPPAAEAVPWYAKEGTQDLMMNFGLNLLAAAEPTPGSAVGPSFGGAIGKAGLATQARSDKQKIRKEDKEAAAATRAFKASENAAEREVKRRANELRAEGNREMRKFREAQLLEEKKQTAGTQIARIEGELRRTKDQLTELYQNVDPPVTDKEAEAYAKKFDVSEDNARYMLQDEKRRRLVDDHEVVKRLERSMRTWQERLGELPAPEPSSMKAAAVGDRALRGIPSGAKKVRRNPDTDEVVYQAADGKWYSPQR